MWKLRNKIFLFFIFLFFGINNSFSEYIVKEKVVSLDASHHENCIENVNMKSPDALEFYWNCRVNLINDHINEVKKDKDFDKEYRKEIQNVKRVILYRREEALDKIYQERYSKRYVQTVFLKDTDWYYFDIINEKFSTEIIYVQQLREVEFLKNKKKEEQERDKRKRESLCYKYKYDLKKYTNCLETLRMSEVCMETLEESVLEKELEYKFECKKEAYTKYPDTLVLHNNEYERLMNLKKDKYIINRKQEEKEKERKKELNKMISGPKISKPQLVDLRKSEERDCLTTKVKDLDIFRSILLEQCEKVKEGLK